MEDCDFLLWINKRKPIKISWFGNEDCFAKNKQYILAALGNGALQWSRESKTSNIPSNLQFTISFEHYNAENFTPNKNDGNGTGGESTFLHLYFINVSNPEEYRITVRPEISEWFANLNEAGCQNWLIVFDSSRAKDRKNRGMTIDKLKSDFARFQNRLFESSEIGSEKVLASLTSLIQQNFFGSLENCVSTLSTRIQGLKASINENTFSLSALINEQLNLAFLYWNFGLFEAASNELDTLSTFLDDSILALAQNDSAMNAHIWLKQLRLLPFDKFCPLLSIQMFANWAQDDWSLVKIHAHLLAHRILLSAQLLNHRLEIATAASAEKSSDIPNPVNQKENSSDAQLNTLQIRHDFLKTIFGHARQTFQRLEENLLALKANYSPILLHCLFAIWQLEVAKFGQNLLGNDAKLEKVVSAATHFNFLLHKKCEAIIYLHSILANKKQKQQEITIARRWLEQTPLTLPSSDSNATKTNKIEQFVGIFKKFMEIFAFDEPKLDEFVRRELSEALEIFRKFSWKGHIFYLEHHLATMSKNLHQIDSYKFGKESIVRFLAGENLLQFGRDPLEYLNEAMGKYKEEMVKQNPELLFDCCLIMLAKIGDDGERRQQIESILTEITESSNSSISIIRNNFSWLAYDSEDQTTNKIHRPMQPIIPFPMQIIRTSPTLLHCILNRPDFLKIELKNTLPFPLDGCTIYVKFSKLTKQSRACQSKHIIFRRTRSTMAANSISVDSSSSAGTAFYNLEYLAPLNESKRPKEDLKEGEKLEAKLANANLQPGLNEHKFQINAGQNVVGCFRLDSMRIECPKRKCAFLLNYGEEMNRNQRLEQIICFADIVKPSIAIIDWENGKNGNKREANAPIELVAGMAQRFWLELNPGTISLKGPTNLSISLVGIENTKLLKFKNSSGQWTNEPLNLEIPALGPNETSKLCIQLCMDIDRIVPSTSATESPTGIESTKIELKLEWANGNTDEMLVPQQFIQLNFKPIFSLISSTSFLADNAIFILDVRRGPANPKIQIVPLEADLRQEQNIALEPVAAKLLNPKPFKAIVANSTFRFIWKLPDSSIGKSVPIPHFLELKYRVENEGNSDEEMEKNWNLVKKRLNFPIQKVEYEICASFYSEHSQSVLCRIDQPCDLVVSLRSLAKLSEAEMVIVSIDDAAADQAQQSAYWRCMDRHKLVKVKESGVGQAIFSIVPKMLGFLPFPPISIYKYNIADQSPPPRHNHSASAINPKRFGDRLISFYRNKGSQIHILAPVQHSDETVSMGSTNASSECSEQKKKSLKSQAKDRLQKLFE